MAKPSVHIRSHGPTATAVLSCLLCLGLGPGVRPAHAAPGDALEVQIKEIRERCDSHPASGESEMLALADRCTSPEEKARVFLATAHMFGVGRRQDAPKMIQYAERALRYPQTPRETSALHGIWGYAIELTITDDKPGSADQAWRQAGRHYLQAYAAVLGGLADPVPDDVRRRFRMVRPRPQNLTPQEQAEFDREYREWLALWEKAQEQNALRLVRPYTVRSVVKCFGKLPDGAAELREAAKGVIEDQATVDELVSALKAASTQAAAATRPTGSNH